MSGTLLVFKHNATTMWSNVWFSCSQNRLHAHWLRITRRGSGDVRGAIRSTKHAFLSRTRLTHCGLLYLAGRGLYCGSWVGEYAPQRLEPSPCCFFSRAAFA